MSRHPASYLLALIAVVLAACGGGTAGDDPTPTSSPPASSSPSTDATEPLPDEALFLALLAAGLDQAYATTPASGSTQVLQNVPGYGAIRWTDDDGHDITVTHRRVAGDPEEWVYVDESEPAANGVTPDEPTAEQAAAIDAFADAVLAAIGYPDVAWTRDYAWLGDGEFGSADFTITEPEGSLHLSYASALRIQRMDVTLPPA